MPRLVKFVLTWNAIGIGIGWVVLAVLLALDVGGLRGMVLRQSGGLIGFWILMLSFGVTFGQVTVMAAMLSLGRSSGDGCETNERFERWKSGHSAELDGHRPLP